MDEESDQWTTLEIREEEHRKEIARMLKRQATQQ